MTKYKIFLIILLVSAGINTAQAQVYKFLTTGFSVMEKNEKGKWGKWSDLEPTSIVITLDTNKDRIVIYSQEVQLYKIIDYNTPEENDEDLIYPFSCAGEDGQPFTLSIITRKSQGGRKQLYINHSDVIIMYNIVNFPEKP